MKINFYFSFLFFFLLSTAGFAQIKPSTNNRFLMTTDNQPFFWLGDTAWELFHRLTREETNEYLDIRKKQGFNVIQAVVICEFKGLTGPNRYGDLPLINNDPTQLKITRGNDTNDSIQYDYWDHIDYVIEKAAEKGMYIGLLPTWGDKVAHLWGEGPIIFNPANAAEYGALIAKRFASKTNVIWILGGDRPVQYTTKKDGQEKAYNDLPIWRAMATSIEGIAGKDAFITYHIANGVQSTSQQIHNEPWLDLNTFQSGHRAREVDVWKWVSRDLALRPQKPTLDMEPCYEDHPVKPWDGWTREGRGYFVAYNVRARVYHSVFAGGSGVTYGHHHVWQFLNEKLYKPINIGDTVNPWQKAVYAHGAIQMGHIKNLMLSRPYFSRVADSQIVVSKKGSTYLDYIIATRDENRTYSFIYLPQNKPIEVDLSRITGSRKKIWWYDPRSGTAIEGKTVKSDAKLRLQPPAGGPDWVLVIDDASMRYKAPGKLQK